VILVRTRTALRRILHVPPTVHTVQLYRHGGPVRISISPGTAAVTVAISGRGPNRRALGGGNGYCPSVFVIRFGGKKIRPPRSLLPGGFCSLSQGVKTRNGETLCQSHLADQHLHRLLEKVDWDLAREACRQGCAYCGGKLHRTNYERKARGGPQWDRRYSFCCAEQDCRRQRTPESVRFLGRKVYAGLVVVLVTTMIHGLKPGRARRIREALQIDWRTLKRWRQWWLDCFVCAAPSGRPPEPGSCLRSASRLCLCRCG